MKKAPLKASRPEARTTRRRAAPDAAPASLAQTPSGYAQWLAELKEKIRTAQLRASLAVSRELILLYWQIGREILQRQGREGWGAKVIDRLAHDLRVAFPGMRGFSPRNLKYMRSFAEAWPEDTFVQQAAAQMPWFHLCTLLDKVHSREERDWYLAKAVEHGWSRNVLVMQIETQAVRRSGRATTNFESALPRPQSDLARESLKDPYRFDFLGLTDEAEEREVEAALVRHITRFLLELGAGFAFVGRQVHLEVGGEDFYPDLLFYHLNSLLHRHRAQGRAVQARAHRQAQFLLERRRLAHQGRARRPDHRPSALQDQEPRHRRVCPSRVEPAHRRRRVPARAGASRAVRGELAEH